ncbi:MAG: type 1 glutamine amidotransferase domain-containing protein, partial [Cyclobacteriaceae bacterium]
PEENTISILATYENDGYREAKNTIKKYCSNKTRPIDRELLAVHSIVAAMQLKITKAVNLIGLLSYSNSWS